MNDAIDEAIRSIIAMQVVLRETVVLSSEANAALAHVAETAGIADHGFGDVANSNAADIDKTIAAMDLLIATLEEWREVCR